ncbi:Zinc finger SWIM domain-containing protein 5 [Taenia solium]|eukprot:TsM_000045800 transcript=TsM_000045800 gene=TsM_000045800
MFATLSRRQVVARGLCLHNASLLWLSANVGGSFVLLALQLPLADEQRIPFCLGMSVTSSSIETNHSAGLIKPEKAKIINDAPTFCAFLIGLQAAAQDPVNCALTALQLTELDAASFEATYQLVVEAAKSGSLGPTHLFSAARHLDARGYPLWAFPLTVHAMRLFSLSGLQESHPVAHDVLWSCLLAHRIGLTALQEILSHVVRNVHCPTLLADILHRCRAPPPPPPPPLPPVPLPTPQYHPHSHHHSNHHHRVDGNHVYTGYYPTSKQAQPPLLPVDAPPLKPLLEATISAFVATTHARLANISPRQYADFLDFLSRARDTFGLLKPDGPAQFRQLVSCLCHSYRGKRKLIALLNERFHHT